MQYDLSSLDTDADILYAELRIYKHSNHVSYTFPGTFVVQSITTDWNENSVTWDGGWDTEGGDLSTEVIDSFAYDGSYNGWFTFDVTEVIKKKREDPQSSFGFMVHIPGDPVTGLSETNQESYFYSSEASESGKTPHITITLGGTGTLSKGVPHSFHKELTLRKGVLSLSVETAAMLEVHTLSGQRVKAITITPGPHQIALRNLSSGCYIFTLRSKISERRSIVRVQ